MRPKKLAYWSVRQPPENAALRTVIDLDIFPLLVNSGEESSVSATEISKKTGADRGLIGKG